MLPGCLLAAGIAVPISVILIVRYGAVLAAEQQGLGVTIILAVLPAMLALGSVICLLLIKAGGKRITRMYGIDLLGACLGAMLVIPLLHWLPTPALAAGCGFLPLGALALYGKRWRVVALSGVVALIALISTTQLLEVTRSKSYDEKVLVPVFEKWTPTARLTIFDETLFGPVADQSGFAWGRGSKYPKGTEVLHYWLEQDGNAGTPITKFDGDLAKLEHLEFDVTTVGYQLRPPRRVAVIGAGGGTGHPVRAPGRAPKRSTAIELNRHTIYAVSKDFAHISGDIYHHPNVNAVASEGRSHLTHTGDKFEFIQISLIDSWAASVAGAFALAENNLYTVEAFGLYLDRMTETGQLSTSRWMREMPRLLLLARAAVLEAGFEPPERHMLLVSAGAVGTLLISKTPYERADIERLREIARERGFIIHYPVVPGHAGDKVYTDLIEGRIGFLRDGGYNTEPPRDDSPYFFHVMTPFASSTALEEHTRKLTAIEANWHEANWQAILVLRRVMWAVSGLAVVLFMLPFLFHRVARREGDPRDWAGLVRASLYFAAIGAGFMLLENMLVQHFVLYLGHPSYATTVIIASLLLGMGVGSSMAGRVGVKRLLAWGWVVADPRLRDRAGPPLAVPCHARAAPRRAHSVRLPDSATVGWTSGPVLPARDAALRRRRQALVLGDQRCIRRGRQRHVPGPVDGVRLSDGRQAQCAYLSDRLGLPARQWQRRIGAPCTLSRQRSRGGAPCSGAGEEGVEEHDSGWPPPACRDLNREAGMRKRIRHRAAARRQPVYSFIFLNTRFGHGTDDPHDPAPDATHVDDVATVPDRLDDRLRDLLRRGGQPLREIQPVGHAGAHEPRLDGHLHGHRRR